jgi:hypothetical protein
LFSCPTFPSCPGTGAAGKIARWCPLFRRPGELMESRSFASLPHERFAFSTAFRPNNDLLTWASQALCAIDLVSNRTATWTPPTVRKPSYRGEARRPRGSPLCRQQPSCHARFDGRNAPGADRTRTPRTGVRSSTQTSGISGHVGALPRLFPPSRIGDTRRFAARGAAQSCLLREPTLPPP